MPEFGSSGELCESCGEVLGENPATCGYCSEYLILKDSERMTEDRARRVTKQGRSWVDEPQWFVPTSLVARVEILVELLEDVWNGKYELPWASVSMAVAAVGYVLWPFDVVPDYLPGIGWLDDVGVVGCAFAVLEVDLRRYLKWKGRDPDKVL